MAVKKVDTDLDFSGIGKIVRALLNPVATDPVSPAIGEVWYNTVSDRLTVQSGTGSVGLATLADVTAGSITGALWTAQSVVVAINNGDPNPQTLNPNTVLGRRAEGNIGAVSYANLLEDLELLGVSAADLQGSNLSSVLSRTNHTGTQLSTTISDFDTAVDNKLIGTTKDSLWTAQSVVVAITNGTPIAQIIGPSTVLGRSTSGNVGALTYAALKADLENLGITAADLQGSTLAQVLARANHTGTQLANTISDFDSAVTSIVETEVGSKAGKYASNIGDGVAQTFIVSHGLATTDVVVSVRVNATGAALDCEITHTDANTVTIRTNSTPATDAYRVVVVG